jgi:hypothetical protein
VPPPGLVAPGGIACDAGVGGLGGARPGAAGGVLPLPQSAYTHVLLVHNAGQVGTAREGGRDGGREATSAEQGGSDRPGGGGSWSRLAEGFWWAAGRGHADPHSATPPAKLDTALSETGSRAGMLPARLVPSAPIPNSPAPPAPPPGVLCSTRKVTHRCNRGWLSNPSDPLSFIAVARLTGPGPRVPAAVHRWATWPPWSCRPWPTSGARWVVNREEQNRKETRPECIHYQSWYGGCQCVARSTRSGHIRCQMGQGGFLKPAWVKEGGTQAPNIFPETSSSSAA